MPRLPLLTFSMAIFGLAVIANGLYRYYSGGGTNGLYFGLVMGGVALLAAGLFLPGWKLAGQIVGWMAVGVVGAWFAYELKGKFAEPRIWALVVLSIAEGVILCLPTGQASPSESGPAAEKPATS